MLPPLSVGAGIGGGRQLREMGRPMPLPSRGPGSCGPSMLLLAEATPASARPCAAASRAAKLLVPPLADAPPAAGWTLPPPIELLLALRPRLSDRAGDNRPAMMCGESGAGATASEEWGMVSGEQHMKPYRMHAGLGAGGQSQSCAARLSSGQKPARNPGTTSYCCTCLHHIWKRHGGGSASCHLLPLRGPGHCPAAPPVRRLCLLPRQRQRPPEQAKAHARARAIAAGMAQQPAPQQARHPALPQVLKRCALWGLPP